MVKSLREYIWKPLLFIFMINNSLLHAQFVLPSNIKLPVNIPKSITYSLGVIKDDRGNEFDADSINIVNDSSGTYVEANDVTTKLDDLDFKAGKLTFGSFNGPVSQGENVRVENNDGDYIEAEIVNVKTDKDGNIYLEGETVKSDNGEKTIDAEKIILNNNGSIDGEKVKVVTRSGSEGYAENVHYNISDTGETIETENFEGFKNGFHLNATTLNQKENEDIDGTEITIRDDQGNVATAETILYMKTDEGEVVAATGFSTEKNGVNINAKSIQKNEDDSIEGTDVEIINNGGERGSAISKKVKREANGDTFAEDIVYQDKNGDQYKVKNIEIRNDEKLVASGVSMVNGVTSVEIGTLTFGEQNATGGPETRSDDSSDAKALSVSIGHRDYTGTMEKLSFSKSENGNTIVTGEGIELNNGEISLNTNALTFENRSAGHDRVAVKNLLVSFGSDGRAEVSSIVVDQYSNRSGYDLSLQGSFESNSLPRDLELEANIIQLENIDLEEFDDGRALIVKAGQQGGIGNISVRLGEVISFEALDENSDASELRTAFYYSEQKREFYLEAALINGDQVEIKILPFRFTSEKSTHHARLKLSGSLNEENIKDYLTTVTGLLDFNYVNRFLSVGSGKMKVRIGAEYGSGFEFIFSNPNKYNELLSTSSSDEKAVFGIGIFNRARNGSERSLGVLVSTVSSFSYKIEQGKGTLSFGNIPLPKEGNLPLTVGVYASSVFKNGNEVFAVLSTSAVDLDQVSFIIGSKRKVNDNTSRKIGFGVSSTGAYTASLSFEVAPKKPVGVPIEKRRKLSKKEYDDLIRTPIRTVRERATQNR